MASHTSILRAQKLCLALLFTFFAAAFCSAQDIKLNLTYVCNGERIYVESCNIRDTSDTSTCQVAHPDRPLHNGFLAYTSETRGTLKKLFPTCTQPTAAEIAKQDAFQKKQQENYAAAVQKANPQAAPVNRPQSTSTSLRPDPIPPPKNAEERAMRRCVSSGRLPATYSPRNPAPRTLSPDGPSFCCATATRAPSPREASLSPQESRRTNTPAQSALPPQRLTARRSGPRSTPAPPQPSAPTPTAPELFPACLQEPTTS
jgi:hypothetical protein